MFTASIAAVCLSLGKCSTLLNVPLFTVFLLNKYSKWMSLLNRLSFGFYTQHSLPDVETQEMFLIIQSEGKLSSAVWIWIWTFADRLHAQKPIEHNRKGKSQTAYNRVLLTGSQKTRCRRQKGKSWGFNPLIHKPMDDVLVSTSKEFTPKCALVSQETSTVDVKDLC